jgi:hypothetical protein
MKPNHVELSAPVTLDKGEARKFNGVAYSGGIAHPSYFGATIVDLESTTATAPLPLLFRHNHDKLSVGVVQSLSNDGKQLLDEGELHTDLEDEGGVLAKGIAARAKKGEPWQQSIGLYDFSEEFIPAQKTVSVNGRLFQGPITIMRNGTVREITFAPLGADPNTNAAVYSTEPTMPEVDQTTRVAELTAELNELKPQLNETKQQVATLTTERDALKEKLDSANKRLAEMRVGQVQSLFADCGLTYDESKAAPYLKMSQEIFDTVSANLRAAHGKQQQSPETDQSLFEHTATSDAAPASGSAPAAFTPRKLKPLSEVYAQS